MNQKKTQAPSVEATLTPSQSAPFNIPRRARAARFMGAGSLGRLGAGVLAAALLAGCGASAVRQPQLASLRATPASSASSATLGQWLGAELMSPGGSAAEAARARALLTASREPWTVRGATAAGVYDAAHGRVAQAAEAFRKALELGRGSSEAYGPLFAEFAASQLAQLDRAGLLEVDDAWLDDLAKSPGKLGSDARLRLAQLRLAHMERAEPKAALEARPAMVGCSTAFRMAGPFGLGRRTELLREFPASNGAPWPAAWPAAKPDREPPRVLDVEQYGCVSYLDESVAGGALYAETFLELDHPAELLLGTSGSKLWVNGKLVLERRPTQWGSGLQDVVGLRLAAGRHRLVMRLHEGSAWAIAMNPDGTPAKVAWSADPGPGSALTSPELLPDPSLLTSFVVDGKPAPLDDDFVRYVAAEIAGGMGQSHVAGALFEPLVADREHAAPVALAVAMNLAKSDPLYDKSKTEDLMRAFAQGASAKDPSLWEPRLFLVESAIASSGEVDAVAPLKELAREFPELALPSQKLTFVYSKLGWRTEERELDQQLGERFQGNADAQRYAVGAWEARGDWKKTEEALQRLRRVAPDSDLFVKRALDRMDLPAVVEELTARRARARDKDAFDEQLRTLGIRRGERGRTLDELRAYAAEEPEDSERGFAVADAEFAMGDPAALDRSLGAAVRAGAGASDLREAIELVSGKTAIERYRLDALAVRAAYEARPDKLEGNAVRVIDRSVWWFRPDGSADVLNHELIRLQSAEAISEFAEWQPRGDRQLALRVLKKDGRVLEPESVEGKPTLTFPHLEEGDYIDAEWVERPASTFGRFLSWKFAEHRVGYVLSEVVLVDDGKTEFHVETGAGAPSEKRVERDGLVLRTWTAVERPPVPSEPAAPRSGSHMAHLSAWNAATASENLEWLSSRYVNLAAVDPRIRTIAEGIVGDIPSDETHARASALYAWVLDNVEPGDEDDGRRVITGKSGDRYEGFETLCRALDIPVSWAITRTQLDAPPDGPLSELDQFEVGMVVLATDKGPVWFMLDSKHAPFGFIPEAIRGADAFLIATGPDGIPTLTKTKVPGADALPKPVALTGRLKLEPNGTALFDVVLSLEESTAIGIRDVLERVPENQRKNFVEQLVGNAFFPGARVADFRLIGAEGREGPLLFKILGEIPSWAAETERGLEVRAPGVEQASGYATLGTRETPLEIDEAARATLDLEVALPDGASLTEPLPKLAVDEPGRRVIVADEFQGGILRLKRDFYLGAGRVEPGDYARFFEFARRAQTADEQRIPVQLRR